MQNRKIVVKAVWDDEAQVWVAKSDDLPGLIAEAPSTDELERELKLLIPELLKLSNTDNLQKEVPIHLLQESHFTAVMA